MTEQGDLLWKDNLTHSSCQVWWRHTYLWQMILHNQKKIYCKDTENELKSYHNKTEWANFVLMQDSWPQLKSDSMTKDTEEFSQFTDPVACREYTLPRDERLSEPRGWIRVNTKIGPVLEVTTCCLRGKYGVEIRIESMNKDHSHSWVRVSHGLNKLVTNLNNKEQDDNEQETSALQFSKTMRWNRKHVLLQADQRPKRNHTDILLPAHPQKLYLLAKEIGPTLNHKIIRSTIIQCQRNWSIFFVMVVYLDKTMERLNSGE